MCKLSFEEVVDDNVLQEFHIVSNCLCIILKKNNLNNYLFLELYACLKISKSYDLVGARYLFHRYLRVVVPTKKKL